MKILKQVMIYGIANYLLKKVYLFVLNKLISRKIAQVILIVNDNSEDENLPNCKFQDISYYTNITKGMKAKALSLLHLNAGSLPKQFDNFKYLINQLQIEFDFIGIAESRLIKGISATTNKSEGLCYTGLPAVLEFLDSLNCS